MAQKLSHIPIDVLVHIEEHMDDPLVLLDKYNKVLWANKKIHAVLPEHFFHGKSIIDLVHFFIEDEHTLVQFLSGAYQDMKLHGPVLTYEVKPGTFICYKNIPDDHKLFWVTGLENFVSKEPLLDEMEYKRIFHQVFDAILIYNSDGIVMDVNTAVCELYKTNREEFIGKNIFSLFPHQTITDATKIWKDFLKTKQIEGLYKFKLADNEYRYIQFKGRADFAGGNHLGILRDVTNSYLAEKALKKSELQLRTVFNSSIYQILLLDDDFNIITFNQGAFGLIYQQVSLDFGIGRSIWEYFPDIFRKQCEAHKSNFFKGESLNTDFYLDFDNNQQWYAASLVPALDDKGELKFISLTLHNITARKTNEEALKKMNFELDSFVYRASHDLRAPLRSVLGLAQLIDVENNKEQIHKYVGLMEKSIQKLDSFILDLTNFSRNSRLDVIIEEIDFNKLIDEAMDNLQFMDKASQVKIVREFDPKLSFYCDQIRLSVILQNLLSNAFKYADKSKAESFLKIKITREDSSLLLEFEDNGIGIIDTYIDKLFSMFFRASQDSYGSGLGLYITKQVVEKLGGSIHVKSVYQQGTSFFVKLPYVSDRNL
ncbi:MAG: sensor histidine kinase [Cytophagaceae bacterium]|jgi:PAS domain S-box-containing protein|nr:sensor histidine kinase [Cytophagaceae bacterium]